MTSWLEQAACRGQDTKLFFSHKPHLIEAARRVCATCPAILPCAEAGQNEYGVWGGRPGRGQALVAARHRNPPKVLSRSQEARRKARARAKQVVA